MKSLIIVQVVWTFTVNLPLKVIVAASDVSIDDSDHDIEDGDSWRDDPYLYEPEWESGFEPEFGASSEDESWHEERLLNTEW